MGGGGRGKGGGGKGSGGRGGGVGKVGGRGGGGKWGKWGGKRGGDGSGDGGGSSKQLLRVGARPVGGAAGAAPRGPLSKRKRGLERLLAKGGLPDDVRRVKEAELAALQGEADRKRRVEREKHFSKKYHGIKFVERRKVEKRLARLRRELEAEPPPKRAARAALEADVTEAEHDLLYIKYFPRSKKYLSLFPATDGDNEFVTKQRARIRALIVHRVSEGLPVGGLAGNSDAQDEELAAATVGMEAAAPLDEDDFFAAGDGSDEDEAAPAPAPARPAQPVEKKKSKKRERPDAEAEEAKSARRKAEKTAKSARKKARREEAAAAKQLKKQRQEAAAPPADT